MAAVGDDLDIINVLGTESVGNTVPTESVGNMVGSESVGNTVGKESEWVGSKRWIVGTETVGLEEKDGTEESVLVGVFVDREMAVGSKGGGWLTKVTATKESVGIVGTALGTGFCKESGGTAFTTEFGTLFRSNFSNFPFSAAVTLPVVVLGRAALVILIFAEVFFGGAVFGIVFFSLFF